VQVSQAGGGSTATTLIDEKPRQVSIAREFVEQSLASFQYKASAQVLQTDLDLKGSLLDAFA
jgi:hypothetical protein